MKARLCKLACRKILVPWFLAGRVARKRLVDLSLGGLSGLMAKPAPSWEERTSGRPLMQYHKSWKSHTPYACSISSGFALQLARPSCIVKGPCLSSEITFFTKRTPTIPQKQPRARRLSQLHQQNAISHLAVATDAQLPDLTTLATFCRLVKAHTTVRPRSSSLLSN